MDASHQTWGLLVPLLMAPLLFVGYARARRLRRHVDDARLNALGLFFLLYGIAALFRAGIALLVALVDHGNTTAILLDPIVHPPDDPWLRLHYGIVHGLLLLAFGLVARQYLRVSLGGGHFSIIGLFAALALPAVEAVVALVPAVLTIRNHRGRHTRRSLQTASGFSALAAGHLALVPAALVPGATAPWLVLLAQTVALAGALMLVTALPRRSG